MTGNVWLGFVGVGLLLSQTSAFFWAGGLFDYRIDFSAHCLYGIWILAVLRSGVFSDTKWTIVAGLVAAWLILTRFITAPCIAGATLLAILLMSLRSLPALFDKSDLKQLRRRITRVGLFLTIVALSTAPFIYVERNAIWKYYGAQHLIGHERHVRVAEQGITDLLGHLTYYPASIWSDHLGLRFIVMSLLLLCVAYALRRVHRNYSAFGGSDFPFPIPEFLFVVATIVAPLIVVTLVPTKSPVVGGIVGVPLALLVLLAVSHFVGAANQRTQGTLLFPWTCATLAAVSMAVGASNYLSNLTGHGPFHNRRVEIAQLMKVYDTIGQYVETVGWKREPSFSVNLISDAMNALVISVVQFERRGTFIRMKRLLGSNIFAAGRDEVFKQLGQTDILVLADTSKRFEINEHYPIHHTLTPLSGDIERWARDKLASLVSTPSVEGRGYRVYVRPAMRVSGLTQSSCIPAEGVWLTGDSRVILQRPLCIVEGTFGRARESAPAVTADLYQSNTPPTPVPAYLEQDESNFRITLDFRKVALRDEGEVSVALRPVSSSNSGNKSTAGGQQTSNLWQWGSIRIEGAPR
jgi:hypothetical protein